MTTTPLQNPQGYDYYSSVIDPTIDGLNEIVGICQNFKTDGEDRIMFAMKMRNWNIDDIERLEQYIMTACLRMQHSLTRVDTFGKEFNQQYATDENTYFDTVFQLMQRIKSFISPLRMLLKRTCNHHHPDKRTCAFYEIPTKSAVQESVLGGGTYHKAMFGMDDPSMPVEVRTFFTQLTTFFLLLGRCMRSCKKVLDDEKRVRNDPDLSLYVLKLYRKQCLKKLKSLLFLLTEDIIKAMEKSCPAYLAYQSSPSEEIFAQNEFHRHTINDMDHFCTIEYYRAMHDHNFDSEELSLWGNNPETIERVRRVVEHFDELLPEDFTQKMMGKYMCYFCQWALPGNIKAGTTYFQNHYHGRWRTVKYGAVNHHVASYNKNDKEVVNFVHAINNLQITPAAPDFPMTKTKNVDFLPTTKQQNVSAH